MADRFAQNRDRLAASIGEGALVVVPAAGETVRNDDVTHSFRQDSSFFFLTGFGEPEAVAVLAPGHPESEFTLFVRPRDREMEVWNGYRAGIEGAKSAYGADAAYEIGDFSKEVRKLAIGRERLYYGMGGSHDDAVLGLLRTMRAYHAAYGVTVPLDILDLGPLLADLRLRKTGEEQEALRAACTLSAEGHMEAMRVAQPGLHEYQVQAAMEAVFGWGGSARRRLSIDSGVGTQRLRPPLRREPAPDGGRRSPAHRRRRRAWLPVCRHHTHFPRERPLHRAAASCVRGGAGGSTSRTGDVQAGRHHP